MKKIIIAAIIIIVIGAIIIGAVYAQKKKNDAAANADGNAATDKTPQKTLPTGPTGPKISASMQKWLDSDKPGGAVEGDTGTGRVKKLPASPKA